MPELQEGVSKQVKPVLLHRPRRQRTRMRVGSLTTGQMRRLAKEGLPAICKNTLIDQAVAGLHWEILNPMGERDAQTEYFTMLINNANDGEGAMPFFSRLAADVLTTLGGGHFEIVLTDDDIPIALYNVDSATIRYLGHDTDPERVWQQSYIPEWPWAQSYEADDVVFFRRNELAHTYWHPVTHMTDDKRNTCPIELCYYYISILASSDDWNLDLLSDPFPVGVLALSGATSEEAEAFKDAWDFAVRGGDLRDLAVIYGIDLRQAQHIKFSRPPTDMAFEITNHWYSSLIAACFEMSILDISILTKVSTKAGAESQERTSAQQGQRKLRRIIDEAVERWVLPEGYQFKWIVPKPEDEATQARAAESRARATMLLTQAFGPERGEELSRDMGLLPAEGGKITRGVEHFRSRVVKDIAIKADLRGYISLSDWEKLNNELVLFQREPPVDLWGQELYDWALEEYGKQLFSALDLWESQTDDDPEGAAEDFQNRYRAALDRAASRAYLAGKQQDADNKEEALAIAAIAFTLAELARIADMIERNNNFFEEFADVLAVEGEEYTRAPWRTGLYVRYLRRFYIAGTASMVDPDRDLIEIIPGEVKTEHCSVCPEYWNRLYTIEEFHKLGGHPPALCEGGDNCKCDIIIHKGVR